MMLRKLTGRLTRQKKMPRSLKLSIQALPKEESAQIIQTATRKAQQRSDEIISEARTEAKGLVDNASREIEREKKIAVNQIKNEITDIAFSAAAAVVEKDMTGDDNERLIEKFIDNVGEM